MRPELIVAVGGLAIRRLLPGRSLGDCIGSSLERDGVTVVPLPHPSGVSRWPNEPANRALLEAAVRLVHARLGAEGRRESGG